MVRITSMSSKIGHVELTFIRGAEQQSQLGEVREVHYTYKEMSGKFCVLGILCF